MKSKVLGLVNGVASLSSDEQIQFAKLWVWRLKQGSQNDLIERILRAFGRYVHVRGRDSRSIESWMESRLVENPSINPKRLAYEYRFYKRTSLEMEPYLYAVARRVKKRMAARMARTGRLTRWPKPQARRRSAGTRANRLLGDPGEAISALDGPGDPPSPVSCPP